MNALSLLGWGIVLGWGAAVPIGPVNVEIARRTLRHGFAAGVTLGLGAVTVDVGYAILVSLGIRPLLQQPGLQIMLGGAGAAFLGWIAYACFRQGWREWKGASDILEQRVPPSGSSHYATGLLLTALNPMTLAFWFLAVPGAVVQITRDGPHDLPWVAGGVAVGAFSWAAIFAGALSLIPNRVRSSRVFAIADFAGGLALAGFAIVTLIAVLRKL